MKNLKGGITRRHFTMSGMAGLAAMALPAQVFASTRDLGEGRLFSFSDGDMNLPVQSVFAEVSAAERDKFVAAAGVTDGRWRRAVNVNLLEIGDRKILFDVGAGKNFLPSLGELQSALEAANVDTGSITDVVFTHAHPDHIWGIFDDFDDLLMPDATYHISRAEWDFWDSDRAMAAMPPGRESFAVGAKSRFDALRDSITLFSPGDEFLPDIEAVDTSGHTPGHASFLIHQPSGSVLIAGDALTHPLISFMHPDWMNPADMDGAAAAAARKTLLGRLAHEKIDLAATHLPSPGFGRVEQYQSSWRYIAHDAP